MNWEKLKPIHIFHKPVTHIYTSTIFDLKDYDKLYENQNNLKHRVWQDFYSKFKTDFKFHNDIRDLDTKYDIICLWFFKDRNDRSGGEDILLSNKTLKYLPNTFLVCESKDIRILEKKDEYIRRPMLQLNMKIQDWRKILERFNKVS